MMPSTLRRSRRRELVLTRSFTRAIQDKVQTQSPRADAKECRTFFADRTNAHPHPHTPLTPTFEASVLASRPSMLLSLYHNSNPQFPLHPIHRLPPELLVHVFFLGSVDDTMFPVLVSHVCHPWRAIALHAHSLWRHVHLSPDSSIHMWKERIRRARPCTLDVLLAPRPLSRTLYDIDVAALQIHLLVPHLPSLRSLDIQFDSYAPYLWNATLGPFCRSTSYLWEHRSPNPGDRSFNGPVEAPKLETLTLRYPQNDDVKEFSLFGGFAPKLARVTLEGVQLTWIPALFENLVFLDYTHHGFSQEELAVDEILSMLQVSSRIRELKLCICHKVTSFQALHLQRPRFGDDNVTLPSLVSLSLRVDNEDSDIPSELLTILSRLSAPQLSDLSLQDRCITTFSPSSRRPFSALPRFLDIIHNTCLRNLVAEGRWFDSSLSRLVVQHPLKSIRMGDMTTPMGVSGM